MIDRACKIRAAWCDERRAFELSSKGVCTDWGDKKIVKWDGGVDSKGATYESAWDRIDKFCTNNNLDPYMLIRAIFYNEQFLPTPNKAYGQWALKKYKDYTAPIAKQDIKSSIEYEFESQQSFTAAKVNSLIQFGNKSEKEALLITVLNSTSPLSALFRYCVLTNQQSPVAAEYEEQAYYQYYRNSDTYDDIWRDWIPVTFRDRKKDSRYEK